LPSHAPRASKNLCWCASRAIQRASAPRLKVLAERVPGSVCSSPVVEAADFDLEESPPNSAYGALVAAASRPAYDSSVGATQCSPLNSTSKCTELGVGDTHDPALQAIAALFRTATGDQCGPDVRAATEHFEAPSTDSRFTAIAILFLLLLLHSSTGGAVRRLVFCTC